MRSLPSSVLGGGVGGGAAGKNGMTLGGKGGGMIEEQAPSLLVERAQEARTARFWTRWRVIWWVVALLALAGLTRYGYGLAQVWRGDDAQLYLGLEQLFQNKTFYQNLDYTRLVGPGVAVPESDRALPNAYPPHTALFYLPFYALPWSASHRLWYFFNIACLVGLGVALFQQFGKRLPRAALPLWLLALFLSTPPYSIARYGGISFPVILGLTLAWRWAGRPGVRATWLAGLFYTIALIKPSLSLPFLIYHLIRRDTRQATLCGLGITLALTLLVAFIGNGPVAMLGEYRATIKGLTAVGAINDTGFLGMRRYYMTHTGVLAFDLIRLVNGVHPGAETARELMMARLLEAAFALPFSVFFVCYALRLNRLRSGEGQAAALDTWALAGLSAFSLLAVYHVWLDLGLLYLPAIVVLNALADPDDRRRAALWALLANLFLLLFVLARDRVIQLAPGALRMSFAALSFQAARILLVVLLVQLVVEMTARFGRAEEQRWKADASPQASLVE